MAFRPTSLDGLTELVTELVAARAGRVRLAVDGPPPTAPVALATAVAERLRPLGRAAVVVDAGDYLRPASVRLEFGREDPDELLTGWLDTGALQREVLGPAADDGDGKVLPRLWNAATDRAHRAAYVELPDDGVVLLAGGLLLGRGLALDATVHLRMSASALARRTVADERWTLPAYERYERENKPADLADVLVMSDHPDRPAVRT